MSKNPFYNAVVASGYIVLVVSTIFGLSHVLGDKESILFPIAGLSLFVFSAAMMGFVFFYQPVLMLLDGQKEGAVKLFLKSIGIFACISAAIFLASVFIVNM